MQTDYSYRLTLRFRAVDHRYFKTLMVASGAANGTKLFRALLHVAFHSELFRSQLIKYMQEH